MRIQHVRKVSVKKNIYQEVFKIGNTAFHSEKVHLINASKTIKIYCSKCLCLSYSPKITKVTITCGPEWLIDQRENEWHLVATH